jgi:hypothetical protein
MKSMLRLIVIVTISLGSRHSFAQESKTNVDEPKGKKNLYIDVHRLEPGKVKYEDVAKAHAKDLQVEKKYGVEFIRYWVDEKKGLVYCLSSAGDTASIRKTHAEAHGLLPAQIYAVTDGREAASINQGNFFLDIHELGAGKVTAHDVDEKSGVVFCLSQATDANAVIKTHREAHGLIPVEVLKIKQGE